MPNSPDEEPDPLAVLLANAPLDDEPFDPADLEYDPTEPRIPHEEVVRHFRELNALPGDKAKADRE